LWCCNVEYEAVPRVGTEKANAFRLQLEKFKEI
jgi:hypothetical protein